MGIGGKVKKAIFLDRDGTINKLKFNQDLNELEPPHCPEDFEMIEGAVEAIKNFANKVIDEYNINRTASWFVGDRESDIICGKLAGLNTAFLTEGQEKLKAELNEDINASNLLEAVEGILKYNIKGICQQ